MKWLIGWILRYAFGLAGFAVFWFLMITGAVWPGLIWFAIYVFIAHLITPKEKQS